MKIFSPALKRQMKDCILAVLWPKKDIYIFFKDHSCPINVLKTIEKWEEKELSRSAMIDQVFEALGSMPDNGTLHFNLMLDSLSNWTHFDDYWFNNQKKLNLDDTKKKIAALKEAKEKNLDKVRERAAKEKGRTTALEERHRSLEEMRKDFQDISINKETVQQRGYAFEKFLTKNGEIL